MNQNLQSISENKPLYALAGASIGNALGKKLGPKIGNFHVKNFCMNADEYVQSRIKVNTPNIKKAIRESNWEEAFKRVAEKATTDYPKIIDGVKTKINKGTALVCSVALAAIGILIASNNAKKNALADTPNSYEGIEQTAEMYKDTEKNLLAKYDSTTAKHPYPKDRYASTTA